MDHRHRGSNQPRPPQPSLTLRCARRRRLQERPRLAGSRLPGALLPPGLSRSPASRDEQLIRINLSCALNGLGEHPQAWRSSTACSGRATARRGRAVAQQPRLHPGLSRRSADALDNLRTRPIFDRRGGAATTPCSCPASSGTRGIAPFSRRRSDGAGGSAAVGPAARGKKPSPCASIPSHRSSRLHRRALVLAGEIARSRGQASEARRRYERATHYAGTEYATCASAAA